MEKNPSIRTIDTSHLVGEVDIQGSQICKLAQVPNSAWHSRGVLGDELHNILVAAHGHDSELGVEVLRK
jgi:hypothetical protein